MDEAPQVKTVILSFSLTDGSITDYYLKLSNRLATGYKVIIITDKLENNSFTIDPTITILRWPSVRPTKFKDFKFVIAVFKQYRPTMTVSLFASVNWVLLAGFLMGVPNRVAWIHTMTTQFPQIKFNVWRRSLLYKLATQIVCNSEATKADAAENFHIPLSKLIVLPNAVEDYIDDLKSFEPDENLILYVGRLHPSKGVDVLVKAFGLIAEHYPEKKLQIIGHGSIKGELLDLVKTRNIKNVEFLGSFKKKQVLEHFKKAYCAIVPSNSEAFGYTVIEAMSMQTCIIGANNSGIKEIIEDGRSGLLFETGNENDLADKIKSVLRDREYRERLAKQGYQRFKMVYSVKVAVERDYRHFSKFL
ncbi:MAG: glycosyltransferase family 4 protein [Flavobacterium sp.]|nr:glycosyltransferase family 4 protein [Flavobacterium sp.]